MFRYRCPHCAQLLQAPEIRAGKTTVCSKCSQPLTIPGDKTRWLNEKGEPLLTSPTVVIRPENLTPPPAATPLLEKAVPRTETDNDVLGAIFLGNISASAVGIGGPPSTDLDLEAVAPVPESAAGKGIPDAEDAASDEAAESVAERKPDRAGPVTQHRKHSPPDTDTIRPQQLPPPPEPEPHVVVAATRPPAEPEPARMPTPPPRHYPRRTVLAPQPDPEPHAPAAVAPEPVPAPRPRPPVPTPRRPVGERPFGPSVSVGAGTPAPAWPGSAGQPTARPRRTVATGPVHPAEAGGTVALDEPLRLRTGMDLAVNLTSALSSRMKPPPRPPRDLNPSTAGWLLLTAAGLALLGVTLFTARDFSQAVGVVGGLQIVLGYAWIVWLAARRDWRRGLVCAVPPLTLGFLAQWKYAKYRPLRFVATGAVFVALAWAAAYFEPQTRAWAGASGGTVPTAPSPENTPRTKADLLRYYEAERNYDKLLDLLKTLAATDPQFSEDAKHRVELAAELKRLCGHADSGVKVEALAAYATWGGADAREMCLEATRQPNRDERLMALRLLPRWKDEGVARTVAGHVGRPGTEGTTAQESLIAIGGPTAERAVVPLLRHADQGVRLIAIDILGNEKVGGAEAVKALQEAATTSPDPGTRQPAAAKAEQIAARLRK